jgi:hypothetical protein
MIKLGIGDEDTNEILLEWFVSARSREISVSRITQMTEDLESIWLQLQTDGPKVKKHNVLRDFAGISGELESVLFFLLIPSNFFLSFEGVCKQTQNEK